MTHLNHPDFSDYEQLIADGLKEDIGNGDLTSMAFIAEDAEASYAIIAREDASLCGVQVAEAVFYTLSDELAVEIFHEDGARVRAGDKVMSISGNARHLLAAERTALNFMSYLSGIATYTQRCVDAVAGTNAQILDTRKTLPAYRALAKYAVLCGGGRNHRMRLDDGVMLKDNHIALAGGLVEAVAKARQVTPALTKIEVECDTIEQVKDAVAAKADVIMLDNMSLEQMREAVGYVDGRVPLEASGGVTLEKLKAIAETGVDFISSGALTHSVKAVDFGMDYQG